VAAGSWRRGVIELASEIRSFQVTVPANTPQSAPVTQSVAFPPRTVTAVRWKVPPGPSGLMGWALTYAGNPVIPRVQGTYIVTDNDADTWPLEGYPDQGNWSVTAYNTDIYPHTVYLDFLLDQNSAATPQPVQIPNADLSSAPADASGITIPPVTVGGP
jgi:hypothetical protein